MGFEQNKQKKLKEANDNNDHISWLIEQFRVLTKEHNEGLSVKDAFSMIIKQNLKDFLKIKDFLISDILNIYQWGQSLDIEFEPGLRQGIKNKLTSLAKEDGVGLINFNEIVERGLRCGLISKQDASTMKKTQAKRMSKESEWEEDSVIEFANNLKKDGIINDQEMDEIRSNLNNRPEFTGE